MTAPDCVFCRIAAGDTEEPANVVQIWHDAIAIVPLNPVVDGHLIVIPTAHVADAVEHPAVTASAMFRAAQLGQSLGSDLNLITSCGPAATQTIRHLHIHVVPRRPGDGLALPWTGVTA